MANSKLSPEARHTANELVDKIWEFFSEDDIPEILDIIVTSIKGKFSDRIEKTKLKVTQLVKLNNKI